MTVDATAAPDHLLQRLRHFHSDYFPLHQQRFQDLVTEGQHPKTLFIGCSDSRLVPYLLTGAGPGELFIVRNVGAFVPPYDESLRSARHHGGDRVCGAEPQGGAHHRVRPQPLRRDSRGLRRRPRRGRCVEGLAQACPRGVAAGAAEPRGAAPAPSSAPSCCSLNA